MIHEESLLAVTEKTGDAAHGLEVFKNNCAKCHRHGDVGESIGPNLTGFAVHPKDKAEPLKKGDALLIKAVCRGIDANENAVILSASLTMPEKAETTHFSVVDKEDPKKKG